MKKRIKKSSVFSAFVENWEISNPVAVVEYILKKIWFISVFYLSFNICNKTLGKMRNIYEC